MNHRFTQLAPERVTSNNGVTYITFRYHTIGAPACFSFSISTEFLGTFVDASEALPTLQLISKYSQRPLQMQNLRSTVDAVPPAYVYGRGENHVKLPLLQPRSSLMGIAILQFVPSEHRNRDLIMRPTFVRSLSKCRSPSHRRVCSISSITSV
jgi:hypothetical protein